MVVVDDLDKGLNARALLDLLGVHGVGDLAGVLVNPSNQGVAVGTLGGALIKLLDDDHLLTSVPTLEDDGDLQE